MERANLKFLSSVFVSIATLVLTASTVYGLTVSLEPATAQREVGGKVRVHIYAEGADSLISMGVKVTFDPAVLEVVEATKFENLDNGWLLDADGNPATTNDQYNTPAVEIDNANGTVVMIGGHMKGVGTAGLNGKVLLGWIVFQAKLNGTSYLSVDLGKYHPDHPSQTFDNFVKLDGTVDEPTNLPGDLGVICIMDGACEGDVNGNGSVAFDDYAKLNTAWGANFGDPNYDPSCDLNGDGSINFPDFAILNNDWGRTCNCP